MSHALEGKHILVVDDDEDMITAIEAVFGDSGATILTANDGDTALSAAVDFEPDLVVLDAMLPKRSGLLVLEKLRNNGKKHGAKPFVIMITGNTGKRQQTWAESLGVDDYLNKPFRMARLVESAEKLLAN